MGSKDKKQGAGHAQKPDASKVEHAGIYIIYLVCSMFFMVALRGSGFHVAVCAARRAYEQPFLG